MKLYDCAVAPNPRRARMFIAEKGLDIPRVEVDILGGENLNSEFLAVNPRGLLPVLELDDGTRFDEVMAICRYLEELHATPPLLGRTPVERAVVCARQRRMEFDGMIAGSEVFRNQHPGFSERSIPGGGGEAIAAIPELVTRGTQTLTRLYRTLEEWLGEAEYLAGDAFTMVDITAFCAVDFAGWVDIGIPANNERSLAWYERVSARDSAGA